ncbi:unnamed protein product [Adineta ricciae]|uniref:G-protein coupled receptors family 1 profile domain-containing protein n=1 Tax=Adineta ricciae TaxID=249248 RepID=A0A814IU27_ADIRI|nr:unnamed protein product [Adineta ricciae]CAF1408859.1 unnamed protein product [Adineta ricciae]
MSNSSSYISDSLKAAPFQLNIWFGSFLWVTGNIGCLGNIIVFRSRSFRERAYSIYLVSEALSDCLYFNFVLLTRVLQKGFQISLTTRYDSICKLRQFVSVWGNQISFTLFTFATIDRILSAQRDNKYRRWSNRVSVAYKATILCLLFWFLLICHRLVLYKTVDGSCIRPTGFYDDYDNYFEVVFTAIMPPVAMYLLAYLLIRSVRGVIQRRITPGNNQPQQTNIKHRTVLQQMDIQLTKMLILQCAVAVLTYVPFAAELIYSNVTQYWTKTPYQRALEKIVVELTHLLSYVFFATSFYVSIVTNVGFRREMLRFIPCSTNLRRSETRCSTLQHAAGSTFTSPYEKTKY